MGGIQEWTESGKADGDSECTEFSYEAVKGLERVGGECELREP